MNLDLLTILDQNSGESYLNAWPILNSPLSIGFKNFTEMYNETEIDGPFQLGNNQIGFETYCYQLADGTWLPAQPSDLSVAVSIHIHSFLDMSLNENSNDKEYL